MASGTLTARSLASLPAAVRFTLAVRLPGRRASGRSAETLAVSGPSAPAEMSTVAVSLSTCQLRPLRWSVTERQPSTISIARPDLGRRFPFRCLWGELFGQQVFHVAAIVTEHERQFWSLRGGGGRGSKCPTGGSPGNGRRWAPAGSTAACPRHPSPQCPARRSARTSRARPTRIRKAPPRLAVARCRPHCEQRGMGGDARQQPDDGCQHYQHREQTQRPPPFLRRRGRGGFFRVHRPLWMFTVPSGGHDLPCEENKNATF